MPGCYRLTLGTRVFFSRLRPDAPVLAEGRQIVGLKPKSQETWPKPETAREKSRYLGYYRLNVGKRCDTARVRTNYMGKRKYPVDKPNGLRHTVWEASESMGCVLLRCNFFFSVRSGDLDILYSSSFSHHVTFYSFISIDKISTCLFFVNGKHPLLNFGLL